jgi:5'-nucleotidase
MVKRKSALLLSLFLVICSVITACEIIDENEVSISILQTSDLHHHANGTGPALDYTPGNTADKDSVTGGYARLSSLIKRIVSVRGKDSVLLIDSGDYLIGSPADMTLFTNPLAFQFFEELKYDAITIGNHEFDYGPAKLAAILNVAKSNMFSIPIVASNLLETTGTGLDLLSSGVDPMIVEQKVITKNGVKIGLLAIMGRSADDYAPTAAPVKFDHNYTDFLQKTVNLLKDPDNNPATDDGVQLVLLLSHEGFSLDANGNAIGADAELAKTVSGIDLIASGHLHNKILASKPLGSETILFSPGENGENLSVLNLVYNKKTKKITKALSIAHKIDDSIAGDMVMQQKIDVTLNMVDQKLLPVFQTIMPGLITDEVLMAPLAKIDMDLDEINTAEETAIGNLCADGIRASANGIVKKTAAAYQANPGAFTVKPDLSPYTLAFLGSGTVRDGLKIGKTGRISFTDIYKTLPLGASPWDGSLTGYPLMDIYMSGADIKKLCAIRLMVKASAQTSEPMPKAYFLNFSGIKFGYSASGMQKLNLAAVEAKKAPAALEQKVKEIAALAMTPPGNADAAAAYEAFVSAGGDLKKTAQELTSLASAGNQSAWEILAKIQDISFALETLNQAAVNAITNVYPYKAGDVACTQVESGVVYDVTTQTPLENAEKYRVALDLYSLAMLPEVKNKFGIILTVYDKLGNVVDSKDYITMRFDFNPLTSTVEEFKEWLSLMLYMQDIFPLDGTGPGAKALYGPNGLGMGRSILE